MVKNPPAIQETWVGYIPGGGHGNPLEYSCLKNPHGRGAWRATVHGVTKSQTRLGHCWASLVAQMVKNSPAVQETWVWSLDCEDPLQEGMQPTPVFLSGESPWTEEPAELQSTGRKELDMTEQLRTTQHRTKFKCFLKLCLPGCGLNKPQRNASLFQSGFRFWNFD